MLTCSNVIKLISHFLRFLLYSMKDIMVYKKLVLCKKKCKSIPRKASVSSAIPISIKHLYKNTWNTNKNSEWLTTEYKIYEKILNKVIKKAKKEYEIKQWIYINNKLGNPTNLSKIEKIKICINYNSDFDLIAYDFIEFFVNIVK